MELKDAIVMPREKADMYGIGALQDYELLALLLETGSTHENVLEMANRLVREKGDLQILLTRSYEEIKTFGINKAKVYRLLAVGEIIRRIPLKLFNRINCIQEFYYIFRNCFYGEKSERTLGVQVDRHGVVLHVDVLGLGIDGRAPLSLDYLRSAKFSENIFGYILCHNHPSGSARPSLSDDKVTKKVAEILARRNIHLIDSVIFADKNFFSYRKEKRGVINFEKTVDAQFNP